MLSAEDVRDLVAERAAAWFPDLRGPVDVPGDVLVRPMSVRPRCRLYEVRVAGPDGVRRAVVKVRDPRPDSAGPLDRPSLVDDRVGAAEQAAAEYAGLRRIEATTDPGDPRFGAVRALDLVPGSAVVVLEHVAAPTLRQVLLGHSRLARTATDRRLRRTDPACWSNTGAWLARFHGAEPGTFGYEIPEVSGFATTERCATRADVLGRFSSYAGYLGERVGPRAAAIANRARDLAADTFPERLPTALSHGDFTPRNVFVEPGGRVSVFDPMPRWRAPWLEDVCRFLVNVRLVGLQVHSHGAAFAGAVLDDIERRFLQGYLGGRRPPGELTGFRLLVLLDKWSAIVSQRPGGWRGTVDRPRARWVDSYLAAEAARLLVAAELS